jgi:TIR domain
LTNYGFRGVCGQSARWNPHKHCGFVEFEKAAIPGFVEREATWAEAIQSVSGYLTLQVTSRGNILAGMPLDQIGKAYAAMLYQNRQETILRDQAEDLGEVSGDFSSRSATQSGAYLSAKAKVMGRSLGLMAEAMAQTLLQAYERSGQSLDQRTLQEITAEVDLFFEAKRKLLRMTADQLVSQVFPGPAQNKNPRLPHALEKQMETELSRATSKAKRDLAIKHHEILLDHRSSAVKGYAAAMGKQWDVFISHASEDKDFVEPLARALAQSGLRVWFDATALTVGDSLRRKIDEGLSSSRYGVVVLSPSFFAKTWPQQELDGLVSKEVEGIKVILPVWHKIDFEGVKARSPMLSGRLAAKSSDGIEKVTIDLRAAMGL